MHNPDFSILITTKNRLSDLKRTLNEVSNLIKNDNVEFIICDDGSTDGTSSFIELSYKTIQLIKNTKSKGLIYSRNRLLNITKAKYAITLDDDAHIVSQEPLEKIESFFKANSKSAVIAFRIFWGIRLPENLNHTLDNTRVKGYVGCGHVWRMEAWRNTPNYPDWFVFYGEEEFASYHLFKKGWEVWFVPDVLVHHRVDVKSRRNLSDYKIRLIRSLRSGWYLYFLFYPMILVPKKLSYTLWIQVKTKILKGDFKAFLAVLSAIFDLIVNLPKLMRNRDALTTKEFKEFINIANTKIYWKPNNEKL